MRRRRLLTHDLRPRRRCVWTRLFILQCSVRRKCWKSCKKLYPAANGSRGIPFINTHTCGGARGSQSATRRCSGVRAQQRVARPCARADDIHRRGGAPPHLARAAALAPSRLPAPLCWKCKFQYWCLLFLKLLIISSFYWYLIPIDITKCETWTVCLWLFIWMFFIYSRLN